MKRTFVTLAAIAFALLALPGTEARAAYPDRPIELEVSYPPGGATDFQARIVTMMASKYLGQPVVIINKPGAGGQVGWNWFATRAKPNGYQLSAYNLPHVISQSIVFHTRYNIHNLVPLANWGADPAVLIVPKDSPFKTVAELVAYARKHPGKVTVSGAGLYVGHDIATLQLERAAHIKLTYVPAKGGVAALRMVLGHQVMAGFNNLSDAYRSRARLRILAVADLHRNKEFLPDVPTLKELGYDVNDASVNFRGIMAPKGTPKKIVDFLAKELPRMFADPKVRAKMRAGGAPMRIMDRAQVEAMFQRKQVYLEKLLANLRR